MRYACLDLDLDSEERRQLVDSPDSGPDSNLLLSINSTTPPHRLYVFPTSTTHHSQRTVRRPSAHPAAHEPTIDGHSSIYFALFFLPHSDCPFQLTLRTYTCPMFLYQHAYTLQTDDYYLPTNLNVIWTRCPIVRSTCMSPHMYGCNRGTRVGRLNGCIPKY